MADQNYSLGGFGERLKAAREALKLSQKDAAVKLHLNPGILQILESENFEKAPPVTFLRGYLRSYARLLNFTEEDISAALTQSGLESQANTPVVPILPTETNLQMGDRYVQWISTAVVLGLFVFVGIWWGFHSSSNSSSNTLARAPTSQPSAPIAAPPVQAARTVTNPPPAAASTTPMTQPVTPTVAQQAPVSPTPPTPSNPGTVATTQQPPAPPTAMPPSNPATPPPVAATVLPSGTPGAPLMTPIDPALQANSTVANEEPKKRRRHRQDNNVSGFAMVLPEPGL